MIKKIETSGTILKRYLAREGVLQKELVVDFGLSKGYISEVLSDKKPVSEEFLHSFKNKFNLSVQDEYNIWLYEKFRKIDPEWQQIILELLNKNNSLIQENEDYEMFLEFKKFFKDKIK